MDILEQHKKEHAAEFRAAPQWQPPGEYGFFVRLVMRLSGGRIRDVHQAAYVLIGIVVLIVVISITMLIRTSGSSIDTRRNYVPAEGNAVRSR